MDGYLFFKQKLVAHVVPPSEVHPQLFKGANRVFKKVGYGAGDEWDNGGDPTAFATLVVASFSTSCPGTCSLHRSSRCPGRRLSASGTTACARLSRRHGARVQRSSVTSRQAFLVQGLTWRRQQSILLMSSPARPLAAPGEDSSRRHGIRLSWPGLDAA